MTPLFPTHCGQQRWWFVLTPGQQAARRGFLSCLRVKLYEALIWLLFSFSEVNFMPVESARGSWAGQETEGLHLPRERSERRKNLALKGQFCPPLSRGLRRKQSKNQIVSCPCCSLIWNLGQLPCSASVFLSVEWEESLRFFFLREILEKKRVFSGLKCFWVYMSTSMIATQSRRTGSASGLWRRYTREIIHFRVFIKFPLCSPDCAHLCVE